MMKEKFVFICQHCGQTHSKWVGRCQECGQWNSVVEERKTSAKGAAKTTTDNTPQPISALSGESLPRLECGSSELNNVLGGGLVPGSVVLLGGEPGIGKSTVLLQVASKLAELNHPILYVSGEESTSQIALRAERLGVKGEKLWVVSETNLERIQNMIEKSQPEVLVLDSVQTLQSSELESQPGSVGQLRECTYQIINLAKARNIATFLVGHVTKDGAIAGPKLLEHMVDVVLYFEGTTSHAFRLLRSIKNRFGSTHEIGVFEMQTQGLKDVNNPSELFLAERPQTVPGSVIVASTEGTRPILVEVQALVSKSPLAIPRRTAIGIDSNRVALLVAILEKRGGYTLFDQDVYVNVAGGLKLSEPAVDLGLTAALLSSFSNRYIDPKSVFFGEVGLGGEVRSVPKADIRLKEARRIGFEKAYVPSRVIEELKKIEGMELIGIEHVGALNDFIQ